MNSHRWIALPLLALMAAAVLAAGDANSNATPPPAHATPTIPLSTKLRFIIRPTLLGLVPPDDPQDFGEVLVRVVSITGDALGLRYEIKERIQKAAPVAALPALEAPAEDTQRITSKPPDRRRRRPVQDAQPALTKLIDATRIRRGLITAQRGADVHRIDLPLFWDDGDWQTDGGLLWLSKSAFAELKASGGIVWEPSCAMWADSPALAELKRLIGERAAALKLDQAAPVRLELTTAEASYPCIVNGERADLPALQAKDSLGLAQYWILADPDNPLVLKLTFQPRDEAAAAPPAEAASKPPAEEASTSSVVDEINATASAKPASQRQQPGRRQASHADKAEQPGQSGAEEAQNSAPGLIDAGSGYAIVEINF